MKERAYNLNFIKVKNLYSAKNNVKRITETKYLEDMGKILAKRHIW